MAQVIATLGDRNVPGDAVQKMNVHSAPAGSPAEGKLAELRELLVSA